MTIFSIVVAVLIALAPPTYEQCFDRYLRELTAINENEGYGVINHWQAVSQRLAARQAYNACRQAAYEEWVWQWWRDTMDVLEH